ncbi:thioredoxin domain-containing protein [Anaerostipes sp.]|uniref:thioredoxin domain-containing protein n=1 Tax=Anaerostipes sp. TaxID=1872530 RepID=UPI0025BA12A9|nr:thioredoxin domain-containing protein [Anaerostipes sp.]MBS7007692.1 thioredoxin domain-containing protein [Anaerostipes sp.]
MSNAKPNLLIHEKSPYLLQHAYNPVRWYPWGSEAFEKAASEDKPVFLSIGYASCHWCHVMEKESFEDRQVADLLNKNFISIKVDREERPDIDAVYMSVCQAMTGSGGWPMSVFLTSGQKPFFAATYLPKTSRYQLTGLMELLPQISALWKQDRIRLLQIGNEITEHLNASGRPAGNISLSEKELSKAVAELKSSYDRTNGGFGSAPKFPTPSILFFLLHQYRQTGDKESLLMAEHTLMRMYQGGIFDHVGGGFSRYSTDAQWLVPHFEKMLYDNALLTEAYAEAYASCFNPVFREAVSSAVSYVLKELSHPEGGFYCSQDADSEGEEGKYYTFSRDEILHVLGEEKGEAFCRQYNITAHGSFENKNIPNLLKVSKAELIPEDVKEMKDTLYGYRKNRTSLFTDKKILTSWNCLMIAALSRSALVLGRRNDLEAAKKAESFLDRHLRKENGLLFLRWCDGEAAYDGQLDDYAFYSLAMLALYRTTFSVEYLKKAVQAADHMISLFYDTEHGGFFLYSKESEPLITRPKELYDGALPSGNSAALQVLTILSGLTADSRYQDCLDKTFACFSAELSAHPSAYCSALTALSAQFCPPRQLVITTKKESLPDDFWKLLSNYHLLDLTVLVKTEHNEDDLASIAPFTKEYPVLPHKISYYLCQGQACSAPVYDTEGLEALLQAAD